MEEKLSKDRVGVERTGWAVYMSIIFMSDEWSLAYWTGYDFGLIAVGH